MSRTKQFIQQICEYLADDSDRFTYGSGTDKNLKVGDLTSDVDGVRAIATPAAAPEREIPVEFYNVDFWAVNRNTNTAMLDLREIFDLFHQKADYQLDDFLVEFSEAVGVIEDLDRDGQNRKLLRLSLKFTTINLIS